MFNLRPFAFVALAFLSYSCQGPGEVYDWSTYDGLGAEHFQKEEVEFPTVRDPIEPVNRGIWKVNEAVLTYAVRPISTGYRAVMPQTARSGIGNFFTNLMFPGRVINCLLQGKLAKSWEETKRFGVNTTVGVLGFRDQASAWGIGKSNEDFGQSFAKWGWRDSAYFVIPFFGPSTARDTVGFVADGFVDPAQYYFPAAPFRNLNRNSDLVEGLVQFMETSYDPYELARLLFVLSRENDVQEFTLEGEVGGATDTLGSVMLKPRDPDFGGEGETYTIVSPATGREIAYTAWIQPEPAPIMYFNPGLGGHRLGSSSLAAAEVSFGNGNSVVTISSLMNFEFIEAGLSAELPGYLPSDTRDVHILLNAIDKELGERFPGRFTSRNLGGISLGAITTLFIAAAEADPENKLIEFDAYIAINSPVSLRHGVDQLDSFFNAPLAYPADEREKRIEGIFRKTLDIATGVIDPGEEAMPFTQLEAKFLIGLSFRNTIRDFIYQTQLRHNMGVLKVDLEESRRVDAYREITQFSFTEYVYAFVLPYYAQRIDHITFDEAGFDRLFEDCDLRSLEDALRANGKIRFASNKNDFLLRPEDIDWITGVLGEDAVLFFERGGHLGNLNRDDVRAALRAEVLEVSP